MASSVALSEPGQLEQALDDLRTSARSSSLAALRPSRSRRCAGRVQFRVDHSSGVRSSWAGVVRELRELVEHPLRRSRRLLGGEYSPAEERDQRDRDAGEEEHAGLARELSDAMRPRAASWNSPPSGSREARAVRCPDPATPVKPVEPTARAGVRTRRPREHEPSGRRCDGASRRRTGRLLRIKGEVDVTSDVRRELEAPIG